MSSTEVLTQVMDLPDETEGVRWSSVLRTALRFCFAYFGLYSLATQLITALVVSATVDVPDPSSVGRCGRLFRGWRRTSFG